MILPTKPTKPKQNFEAFTTLIYGAPKTGKSTLASQFENPLFLATEAGLNSLETYSVMVDSWQVFLEACKEISEGKHNFKTIIIDTVDNLFDICSAYICRKNKIQYEGDLEWGKGFKLTKDEFKRAINKLSLLPYGLVFISHSELVDIKTRTEMLSRYEPSVSKRIREDLLAMCDFIFYCDVEYTEDGEQRILHTKPSKEWVAGDRTGIFPEEIPMNYKAIRENFSKATNGGSN